MRILMEEIITDQERIHILMMQRDVLHAANEMLRHESLWRETKDKFQDLQKTLGEEVSRIAKECESRGRAFDPEKVLDVPKPTNRPVQVPTHDNGVAK
jgi:hypothetical protein